MLHRFSILPLLQKWKEEAPSQAQPASSDASVPLSASEGASEKIDMTEKLVDWCIAELQFKAKAFQENGGLVSIYNGDVVKSDAAIPPGLQASLRAAVAPLEEHTRPSQRLASRFRRHGP
jgi:hypothetical protein